jgi:hypothetical protein
LHLYGSDCAIWTNSSSILASTYNEAAQTRGVSFPSKRISKPTLLWSGRGPKKEEKHIIVASSSAPTRLSPTSCSTTTILPRSVLCCRTSLFPTPAGAADAPDFVLQYLFFGINPPLISSTLCSGTQAYADAVRARGAGCPVDGEVIGCQGKEKYVITS